MLMSFLKKHGLKFLKRNIAPHNQDAKIVRQKSWDTFIKDCALKDLRGVEIDPFVDPRCPRANSPRLST